MDTLYRHGYDLSSAISVLVPLGGPVLCRDEMEEWSASEASLFEEALEKYGKDFNDIRQDFVSRKLRMTFLMGIFLHFISPVTLLHLTRLWCSFAGVRDQSQGLEHGFCY